MEDNNDEEDTGGSSREETGPSNGGEGCPIEYAGMPKREPERADEHVPPPH